MSHQDVIHQIQSPTSVVYSQRLLSRLYSQFVNELFCDVRLVVGERTFNVHRNVLSAASVYFEAMFAGNLEESRKESVAIHDISPMIVEKLLRYIYTGVVVNVTCEDAQDLLAAADMLQLTDVVDVCCRFLIAELHPSNCIGIYCFAEALSCVELKKSAESFINSRFMEVSQSEEFIQIPVDDLIHFLCSETLSTNGEYQVFASAMKWVCADIVDRLEHIHDILSAVRLPLIPQQLLMKYVEGCQDLSVKAALQSFFQDCPFLKPLCSQPLIPQHLLTKYVENCPDPSVKLALQDLFQKSPSKMRVVNMKPLCSQPRKYAGRTVYVIGGYTREDGEQWGDAQCLDTVEIFNTFTKLWTPAPRLNSPRSGHASAVLDGSVYVIGGESDSVIHDSVERLDPVEDRWVLAPPLIIPRSGLAVCTVNDRMYVFGGRVVGSEQIGRTVECFDSRENRWMVTGKVSGHSHRHAMGIVELKGLIYLIGGMNEFGLELSDVSSYDPVTDEWTQLSPLSSKRAYVGVSCLDGCIYAVGGTSEAAGTLRSVEKYSVEENCWSYVDPLWMGRVGAVVASGSGCLFAFGGREDGSETRAPATMLSCECYDPDEDDNWSFVCNRLTVSRCEASIAVI